MNIFELLHERYKLPVTPKLFEAFSGIGCQLMAFKRLGIEVDSIGFSEIDKYAIQSYRAIHGDIKNWGSITDIKGADLPQIDVFTYSFPCTDLSKAGKQKGLTDTRSGLVYEVLRILHELDEVGRKPQVLIMENVVDLVQSKFIKQFQEIQVELEQLGYTNYTQTLNAKEYGVAQNRDRVFMVSILGDYYYEFPQTIQLEKRLKDYLENEVASNYYLSDTSIKGLTAALERRNTTIENEIDTNKLNLIQYPRGENKGGRISNQISPTIDQATGARNTAIIIDNSFNNSREPRLYEDVCPTLNTMSGGNREPKVALLGNVGKNGTSQSGNVYDKEELAPTLCATDYKCPPKFVEKSLRIRKLTPLECWRLMGIDDDDFHKAKAGGVSNSQLYKQAGNGIVVDVFAAILRMIT